MYLVYFVSRDFNNKSITLSFIAHNSKYLRYPLVAPDGVITFHSTTTFDNNHSTMKAKMNSKIGWILSQSLLFASPSMASASTSKISFCPRGETVSTQLINRKSPTMLKTMVEIRGGSDRDYGYSGSGGRGRYDDTSGRSSGGYYYDDDRYGGSGGYGDDRYGAQQDYNDDRYGERSQGGGYEDDYYYGESQNYRERGNAPSVSSVGAKAQISMLFGLYMKKNSTLKRWIY